MNVGAAVGAEVLLEAVGKGRPLRRDAGVALRKLLGVEVGLEGLSRLFQPGFPGVRAFAIEGRAAPDQAVEITLVGIARDGRPVWTGSRAFALGRDGSLEIHRGFDEIDPEYQSRNITVDLMQRELDILALLDQGQASRLTIDAEGVGRYVCALHGFVFADETEEGPPVRSVRALEPSGDREKLRAAALSICQRAAERRGLGKIAQEAAEAQIRAAQSPWDFARLSLGPTPAELAKSDDGEMGVGNLGRELLLAKETPGWRAALYLHPRDEETFRSGAEYRRRKTLRSETRIASELQEARQGLESRHRALRLRALENLGMVAPAWMAGEIKLLTEDSDRRLAAAAKATLRQVSGADLPDRLLAFANDTKQSPRRRGLVYRVLAEHFPDRLKEQVPMLRVNPDTRIQRAIVPLVADEPDPGPALAALLAANPWPKKRSREGLAELRLELIERLALLLDPSTVPVLMEAFRHREQSPPQSELLALSRALVAFPDPRAQVVLVEAARRFQRPQIP